MSDQEKRGPYVYQPFGVQHPDHWKTGRIYGIGGLPLEATCRGFTKTEAEAICAALKPVTSASIEEAKDELTLAVNAYRDAEGPNALILAANKAAAWYRVINARDALITAVRQGQ